MRSSATIAGHPIHPMLIPLPIGLWVFSLIADLVYFWRGNVGWEIAAYYTLLVGIAGAVLAAIFGLIDLLGIKDSRAYRTGLMHAGFNVVGLVIFAVDFYLRTMGGRQIVGEDSKIPFALSVIGIVFLAVAGWLGGELVFRYGVGVEGVANPNIENAER